MNNLLLISGPTASGKTALGIKLAKEFNGEIISADSRQVYQFMDIGPGKDPEEYQKTGTPVWGLDLVTPDYAFNVSDFVAYANEAISNIQSRGKLPIVVGGTGLYIKALLEPIETINIPPDLKLRQELDKLSVNDLQIKLQQFDNNKWQKMNTSDRSNPRRLIRAIEVAQSTIKNKKSQSSLSPKISLVILSAPIEDLKNKINSRVSSRISNGVIEETKNLIAKGYSWTLPSMSSLGYSQLKEFLDGSISLDEAIKSWQQAEYAYAKRQIVFLKKLYQEQKIKDLKVLWQDVSEPNFQDKIAKWYSDS